MTLIAGARPTMLNDVKITRLGGGRQEKKASFVGIFTSRGLTTEGYDYREATLVLKISRNSAGSVVGFLQTNSSQT